MLLQLLFQNPALFIILASSLVVSLSVHEFAHAFTAYKLGDPTAKYLGRVSLNPLRHLDPVGTLLLLVAGFGWGKPVPFNPENLQNPKRDGAIIAFAGPLSNILMAVLGALCIHFFVGNITNNPVFGGVGESSLFGGATTLIHSFLYFFVYFNLILAVFNLIPIHPLDGFKVVLGLLPWHLAHQWVQMEPYGMFILLFLVVTRSISLILLPLVDLGLRILGVS